jgi:hypothetical protein
MFDGFPRTLEQARQLDATLAQLGARVDQVFLLEVPTPVIVSRLSGRRICKSCGAVYHVTNIPSKVEGICDQCGGSFYQRPDDSEETVLNRLEVYQRQTASLIDFYEQKGILVRVNAGTSPGGDRGAALQAGLGPAAPMIPIKTDGGSPADARGLPALRGAAGGMAAQVRPGVTTGELDAFAGEWIRARGVGSAFFGYGGFPGQTCISLNEEVVHGIPGPRVVNAGDLVSLDVGVVAEGFIGDNATTVRVGAVDAESERLCAVCEAAWRPPSMPAAPGTAWATWAMRCSPWPRPPGFRWCGISAGTAWAQAPRGAAGAQLRPARQGAGAEAGHDAGHRADDQPGLFPGGDPGQRLDGQDRDRKRSAHFEHTVLVVADGPAEILTCAEKK